MSTRAGVSSEAWGPLPSFCGVSRAHFLAAVELMAACCCFWDNRIISLLVSVLRKGLNPLLNGSRD